MLSMPSVPDVSDVQFEQATDTEMAWLTEAERKLSSLGDIKLEPEQTTAQLQAQKVSMTRPKKNSR